MQNYPRKHTGKNSKDGKNIWGTTMSKLYSFHHGGGGGGGRWGRFNFFFMKTIGAKIIIVELCTHSSKNVGEGI